MKLLKDSELHKHRETVIEVKGMTITRGGADVVRNASATIKRGDYVGIVGPNGGGKTTLIKGILGMIPLRTGEVRIFGRSISEFQEWNRIAYVSQDAINFDEQFPLTVYELISLGRLNRKNMGRRMKSEDRKVISETLDYMGLSDIQDKRIGKLSGGQKQRVFIAKALVRRPEILFLDEPVAGVDADNMERFYKLLSNLNQEKNITIVMVSHDLSVVFCRMSKVVCVNRDVNASDVDMVMDPNDLLKKAYGEHFQFVFHRHECKGRFGA